MSRTSARCEQRKAIFLELYEQWTCRQITQARAAGLLGVSERTFRRYVAKYRKLGRNGLEDRRTTNARKAPPEEVAALTQLYTEGHLGRSVREFFRVYRDSHGGGRSYTWVKSRLYEAGLAPPGQRTRSEPVSGKRKPAEGLLLHQAGCTSEWLPARKWELVAVVDDASRRVYSGLFVEGEAISYRFRTVHETILANGLFGAIHVDRAMRSHHDLRSRRAFPRAMRSLGIDVLLSCPMEARNRYQSVFQVLRESLPQHLTDAGIQSRRGANAFLRSYWRKLNRFFTIEPKRSKPAFAPLLPGFKAEVAELLCLGKPIDVGTDNRARHRGRHISTPAPGEEENWGRGLPGAFPTKVHTLER